MQCHKSVLLRDQTLSSVIRAMPAAFSGRHAVSGKEPAHFISLAAGRLFSPAPSQPWLTSPPHSLRFGPCLAGEVQGASCNIVREAGLAGRAVVEAAPLAELPPPQEFAWPGEFETRYEMGEVLGRGSFGTVRTAFDRKTGRTLAVKIIPKSKKDVEPERILHRIREEV